MYSWKDWAFVSAWVGAIVAAYYVGGWLLF